MTGKLLKFPSAVTMLEDLLKQAKDGKIKQLLAATTDKVNGVDVRFSRTSMTLQQQLFMAITLVEIAQLEPGEK